MVTVKKQPRRSVAIAARLITALVPLAGAEGMLWFGGYPSLGWSPSRVRAGPGSGLESSPKASSLWCGRITPIPATRFITQIGAEDGGRPRRRNPSGAPNQPRVLFFGDSFIQGYGLSEPETPTPLQLCIRMPRGW